MPGAISTKAPKPMSRRTFPVIFWPTANRPSIDSQGSPAACLTDRAIFFWFGFFPSSMLSTFTVRDSPTETSSSGLSTRDQLNSLMWTIPSTPGASSTKAPKGHEAHHRAAQHIAGVQGGEKFPPAFFLGLGQQLFSGHDDVSAALLEPGDAKLEGLSDIVLRIFDVFQIDLADGTKRPALEDFHMESALAGLLDAAFHRHLGVIGLLEHVKPADTGHGFGKPDFALGAGHHVELDPVADLAGQVAVFIHQFVFFHHAVDFGAGIEIHGIPADGDDFSTDPVSDLNVFVHARCRRLPEARQSFRRPLLRRDPPHSLRPSFCSLVLAAAPCRDPVTQTSNIPKGKINRKPATSPKGASPYRPATICSGISP